MASSSIDDNNMLSAKTRHALRVNVFIQPQLVDIHHWTELLRYRGSLSRSDRQGFGGCTSSFEGGRIGMLCV